MSKKKTFRVTFIQESYTQGHVDVDADNACEAMDLAGQDEYTDNIIWDEFNDGGELFASDVWEIKE